MKKLTNREKLSLALVAIVAVVAFALLFFRVMLPNWRQLNSDIITKLSRLDVAQKLKNFETTAMALEDRLQKKTGLQGKAIISDELFKTLQNELTVDNDDKDKININIVGNPQRLTRIEGVDIGIANSILEYRRRIGKFDNLGQLKEIRGNIFEGENAQAVISRRLVQIAHQNGIRKINRFEPKLLLSKKKKTISANAKKTLINEIYLSELDDEIKALRKMESEDEKATGNPKIAGNREFPLLPSAIPVKLRLQVAKGILAHEGKVKLRPLEFEGATVSEAKEEALMALKATEDEVDVKVLDKGRKGFLGIMAKPALIRVSLKEDGLGIIAAFRQAIRDYNVEIEETIREEEGSDLYSDEGDYGYWDEGGLETDDFFSDYDDFYGDDSESYEETPSEDAKSESDVKSDSADVKPSGEKDSGEKEEVSNEVDVPKAKQDEVSEEYTEETKQESIEDKIKRAKLNEDVLVTKLVDYLVEVSEIKEQLREWLDAKSMPSQYLKQNYVVDMSFKCKLENLVKFIYNVESQLKWLYVRGLKISISERKEGTILNADITFVATIM